MLTKRLKPLLTFPQALFFFHYFNVAFFIFPDVTSAVPPLLLPLFSLSFFFFNGPEHTAAFHCCCSFYFAGSYTDQIKMEDKRPTFANADDKEDVGGPLYIIAKRWRSHLLEHSATFKSLQEERERGWRSSALDAWYARRYAPTTAAAVADTAAGKNTKPLTTSKQSSSDTTAAACPAAVGATSFAEADVPTLAERYRQHARRITQHAAGAFFSPSSSSTAPPLFLDLGCAPGGVSKYLLEDLRWRGVGVTLASTSGGIDVDPALIDEDVHGHDYVLLDGDVTQPPASWCRSAAYARQASHRMAENKRVKESSVSLTSVASMSDWVFQAEASQQPRFHFVNGGAVLDHGQREHWAKAVEEGVRGDASPDEKKTQKGVGCSADVAACPVAAPVLPWFSLLAPQLETALSYVAEGGGMMLVHGAPHCASLFILLRCMEDIVGGGSGVAAHTGTPDSLATSGCQTAVLETMHLAKSPVYVLWTNIKRASAETGAEVAAQASCDASRGAQQRLLASLDPASPRISPLEPEAAPTLSYSNTLPSRAAEHSLMEAKQRFWLGESDDGFRLAVEGFARYGAQVEAIWSRVELFLRRRRERAEREVALASAAPHPHRGRNGSKYTGNLSKRMRSDD